MAAVQVGGDPQTRQFHGYKERFIWGNSKLPWLPLRAARIARMGSYGRGGGRVGAGGHVMLQREEVR